MSRKKKLLLVALVMAGVCALPLSIAGCKNKGNNGTNITEPEVPLDPEAGCKHEHMSHETETDSNCTTRGHQEYWYCSDCNKYYTDAEGKNETTLTAVTKALDLTRHNYGDWVDAEPATCSETGLAAHYECEDCHHYFDADYEEVTKASLEIAIDAEAHDWKLVSETPATCTSDGLKTYVCNHNDEHTYTEPIKSQGHQWSVGHVVKKATCTEKGILSFTCTVDDCGATKTEDIPALGHDWTEYEYVAAEGVYKRTCKHSEGDDQHEACAAFETIVAGSSEQYYIPAGTADELKAALEKGGYIKLTADIEVTDGSTLTVAKAANLDLNNHEIKTNSGESILINTAEAVVIRNGKISTTSTERAGEIIHLAASSDKVTLSGLTVSGVSGDTYYGIYGVRIEENANAQINGCNLSGLSYAIALSGNGAKVTVNGGSITNSQVGVTGNGKFDNNTITLTDLTVNAVDTAVYNPQGGTTIITGGTYTAEIGCALEVRAGAVTVTNATLAATGEFSKAPNGSGTTITGTAIGVSQHTTDKTIRLTVSGSSLSGVCALYEKDLQNDEAHDAIKILLSNDNTINGCVYSQNTEIAQNHLHVTEAWVYNPAKAVYEKVCDNCNEVAETLAAGTEDMPCLVNDAASLKVALENGGHIKFTADVTFDEVINLNKDVIIDLNGNALKDNYVSADERPLYVGAGVTVSMKNGKLTFAEENTSSLGIVALNGVGGKLLLNNVDLTSTGSGSTIIRAGADDCEINLDHCYGTTNYLFVNMYGVYSGKLTVTGGTYNLVTNSIGSSDSDYFAGFKLAGKLTSKVVDAEEPVYDLSAEFDGVTINSGSRLGCEVGAAKAVFNNCTIGNPQNNGVYGYLESAIATCNVGYVVINGGEYSGKYAAYTFNSAGTIEINGGTFNGNFRCDVSADCHGDAKIILNETETPIVWDTTKYNYSAGGSSDTYKSYFIKNVSTAAGLTEAVKTNGTVVLNEDITADVVIAKGVNVTIDLNGHTLTGDKNHTIVNHGTLNLIGGGKVYNGTHKKGALWNDGTVTVKGVALNRPYASDNTWYTIYNETTGVMTLEDVDVSTEPKDTYSSLVCNNGATLTIESGSFATGLIAVKNDDNGTLTINGGEFSGNQSVQNWGVATINGGKFNNDITTGTWKDDFEQPVTTINGGEYNGVRLLTVYNTSLVKMPVLKVKGAEVAPVIQVSGGVATGFSVETSEDGEYNVYALKAPAFVSNEAELKAAVAKGGYVKVLNDIPLATTVEISADTNINLNGYTLTSTVADGAAIIAKSGKVTINDGSVISNNYIGLIVAPAAECELTDCNVTAKIYGVYANGKVTITGGTITGDTMGLAIFNGGFVEATGITVTSKVYGAQVGNGAEAKKGTLILHGGTIAGGSSCGIIAYGYSTVTAEGTTISSTGNIGVMGNGTCVGDTITLTNCTVSGKKVGLYFPQKESNLKVTGGSYTGEMSGIEVRGGTAVINGATLNSTAKTFSAVANGDGATVTGAALAVSQHSTDGTISVTVNASTLNGIYAIYEKDVQNTTKRDQISITLGEGNTFNGCSYSDNCANIDKVDAVLGEWTYADGNYTREDGATVVAGSSECFPVLVSNATTLATAVANGGYIKLLNDISSKTVKIQNVDSVVIDLNNYTLTGTSTAQRVIQIYPTAKNVTIKNGNVVSKFNYINGTTKYYPCGIQTAYNGASAEVHSTVNLDNVTVDVTDATNYIGEEGTPTYGGNAPIAVQFNDYTVATLNNCTLKAEGLYNSSGLNVWKEVDVTLNDCNISSKGACISNNGSKTDGVNPTFTINNVTANSIDGSALYLPAVGGQTTINGGSYTGAMCGIEIRGGNLTVDNAEITGNLDPAAFQANGVGTSMGGAAIGVSQHTHDAAIEVEVNNSTLNGVYALIEKDLENDTARDVISVTLGENVTINGYVYSENCENIVDTADDSGNALTEENA